MCDTLVATPDSTANRVMLFGKNSDRQRNEGQAVEYIPRREYTVDAALRCTYITIPQVSRTHAVVLCRPFWLWGAEMGVNEFGVTIGNEALRARCPPPEQEALVGMDLLRLALERSRNAQEAVEVIITLLEQYGQGGNCGHLTTSYYNNGFMIADPTEAFVLETVGREWLLERVQGVRSISNRYSIGRDPERTSAGLPTMVRDSGWSTEERPDYSQAIANTDREHIGNAGVRRACSTALLQMHAGRLSAADLMRILRDHGSGADHHLEWREECIVQRTLCMHAGAADRHGQTVGSMVCELKRERPVHWVTGTAAPCVSIFKPVLMDVAPPPTGPTPGDRFDPKTLWWRHERLHRAALMSDLCRFLEEIRPEQEAIEAEFRARIAAVLDGGNALERARVIAECWQKADHVEAGWHARLKPASTTHPTNYDVAWRQLSELAGMREVT